MEIALWGSYNYGNFGDDLMADLISSRLTGLGHSVKVVSVNPDILSGASAADISIVPTLDACRDVDIVVIGGGAMLSPEPISHYLLRRDSRNVDREFRDLRRYCAKTRTPVYAISIGGAGSGRVWGNRRRFFSGRTFRGGTVRLKSDQQVAANAFGKRLEYAPDVLFGISHLCATESDPPAERRTLRVGVNLHLKRASGVVEELQARFGRTIELCPIQTHSKYPATPYEWGVDQPGAIRYRNLSQFLAELRSLDLVVSDKLHLGLAAAVMGVSFLSYQPKEKTRQLFREMGCEYHVLIDPAGVRNALESGSYSDGFRERVGELGLVDQAEQHFDLFEDFIAARI